MKKVLISMIILSAMVLFTGMAAHAQLTDSVTVSATISGTNQLEMSNVFSVDGNDTPTDYTDDVWVDTGAKNITFGTLTHTLPDSTDAGLWYSRPYHYVVFLTGWTFGTPYQITSTCSGLVGSVGGVLPRGVGITPGYNPADNGGQAMPAAASLGTGGPLHSTGKILYSSGASANLRTIQANIGIPPYVAGGGDPFAGHEPIPLDQMADSYSGTVTFTLVLL